MGSALISEHEAQQQVGKGWHGLLRAVYARLPEPVEVVQVKEKWDGLRVYVEHADDAFLDYLDVIESRSLRTCAACGKAGRKRK